MEDIEILNLWKSYDKKIEQSLSLNRKNAEEITKIKVSSLLSSMKPLKIFAIFVGLVWVGLGGGIIINLFLFDFATISKFFLISAGIQVLLTAIALVIYFYQLVLIHQVDLGRPVLEAQRRLSSLKSSTLWTARILFLQLPLWTTFYLSESVFINGNTILLVVQGSVTVSFTFISVWLFLNIKYENRNKKWFRLIFDGKEWTPMLQSMEMLSQIDKYETS
ncbi:hypothetical protein SAMN05518672_10415 [Chitinophaga sp. CF118]|uniref:hypothetical protein n=1 Tax=Chitinophaga sp. CF118 TaxID=1884367 RepID=UPI0008E8731E|nr:hypothetical protein [Chitinophaga sp. CF118]SFD97953.1 hypothetical protein SAMN05518672_10415 [Chitinophaga sp. CF118]